jgi:hypothetical protein
MLHSSDLHYDYIYHFEHRKKLREAQEFLELKKAGIDPFLPNLARLKKAARTFILRLTLFERPENPCLDCPPAGA